MDLMDAPARRLAALLLALAFGSALHAANCPPPPPCPPPEGASCDGTTDTTFTFSTTSCEGDVPSETITEEETIGNSPFGVDICIGPEKSEGFHVCPGTVNYNENTETVSRPNVLFSDGYEQPGG